MPRYYFDLKNGARARDHGGLELDSDDAAIEQAKVIAREIALTKLSGSHPERFVSVIHEAGYEVTKVPVE